MRESPQTQHIDNGDDKDSMEDTLKAWDKNDDGFIDKTEVRTPLVSFNQTLST